MVQSRAQFGFRGAVLPMVITVVMYLGFAIEGGVVVGRSIGAMFGVEPALGVIVFNAAVLLIALVGYDLIHSVSKVFTIVSAIVFAALFISLAADLGSVPAGAPVAWQAVLLAISIFAAWQITWAPYVSDYSRYLPKDTPMAKTFWYTYLGSAVGASLTMMIGAFAVLVAGEAFGADAVGFLAGRFPAVEGLLFVAILASIVPAGAEGPYGAFLTSLAAVSERGLSHANTPKVRAAFVTGFTVIATALAVAASADLLGTFLNITLFLLYLLVPWTAINLTDYYLVRRGHYNIPELFKRDGLYGLISWRAVILYLVTIAIEVPFISSPLYTGPIAESLGFDIAWILGLIIPTVGYVVLVRRQPQEPETLLTGEEGSMA
jgi:NCS1 family nucleobase:cation symporter-1